MTLSQAIYDSGFDPFEASFDPKDSAKGQSHFQLSFLFVPNPLRRRALEDFYAFCRLVDDIADEDFASPQDRRQMLDDILAWLQNPQAHSAFWQRLQSHIQKFELPVQCFEGIINGVAFDLNDKVEFATWDELYSYIQGVACDVGEVVLHILGAKDSRSKDYAQSMGRCVQLLNIMRDLEKDIQENRHYLPHEFLLQLGINRSQIQERLPYIRHKLFEIAMKYRQKAEPYSYKCFAAELMVNSYVQAARAYWQFGLSERLNRVQKMAVLFGGAKKSIANLV